MRHILSRGHLLAGAAIMASTVISAPTWAQNTRQDAMAAGEDPGNRDILVTGSRIRRDANDSALPLQIVTRTSDTAL